MQLVDEADELELKKRARRRLVGAVVLVLLVVTLVPLILDNEPRKISDDVEINIASKSGLQDPVPSLGLETFNEPGSSARSIDEEQGSAGASDAVDGYVVQLGAFSKINFVQRFAKKLEAANFPVILESFEGSNGPMTRVYVGSYSSKDKASRALSRLKAQSLTYGEPLIKSRLLTTKP
jgi:DedD protein